MANVYVIIMQSRHTPNALLLVLSSNNLLYTAFLKSDVFLKNAYCDSCLLVHDYMQSPVTLPRHSLIQCDCNCTAMFNHFNFYIEWSIWKDENKQNSSQVSTYP